MRALLHRLAHALICVGVVGCGTPTTGVDTARPPVIELLSGGAQQHLLGLPLAAPIRIRVTDADGMPIVATRVRAQVAAPFAVIEPAQGVTDPTGMLDLTWRTGAVVGAQQLTLTLPDAPGAAALVVGATATSAPLLDLAGGAQLLCGIWAGGTLGCWAPTASAVETPTVVRHATGGPFTELAIHQALAGTTRGCASATTGRLWCFDVAVGGGIVGATDLAGSYPALHGLATGIDSDAALPPFCGLASDGAAWCWGSNLDGALGDGTFVDRARPVPVATPLRFQMVTTGARHSCGLALDGVAWCWGANESGQLGRPISETSQGGPRQVDPSFRFRTLRVLGPDVSCGIGVGGGLRCWGNKQHLGLGVLADSVPGDAITRPTPPRGVLQAVSFAEVDSAIIAVESDGRGSWWGILPVAHQRLQAEEPRSFDRLLPFAEFSVPSSRGLVCGRPFQAMATVCIRTGVLTGFDFAVPNPTLLVIGMPS